MRTIPSQNRLSTFPPKPANGTNWKVGDQSNQIPNFPANQIRPFVPCEMLAVFSEKSEDSFLGGSVCHIGKGFRAFDAAMVAPDSINIMKVGNLDSAEDEIEIHCVVIFDRIVADSIMERSMVEISRRIAGKWIDVQAENEIEQSHFSRFVDIDDAIFAVPDVAISNNETQVW